MLAKHIGGGTGTNMACGGDQPGDGPVPLGTWLQFSSPGDRSAQKRQPMRAPQVAQYTSATRMSPWVRGQRVFTSTWSWGISAAGRADLSSSLCWAG